MQHTQRAGSAGATWALTILRAHGLGLLRREKSWRPIITVVVDKHETHETVLGSDGQNINLKAPFLFHDANANSRVEIQIWHLSQSKKKKRRNPVGSASLTLGELAKRQATEQKIDIRLTCSGIVRTNSASKGKPQNGAYLTVRVRLPLVPEPDPPSTSPVSTEFLDDTASSVSSHSSPVSETPQDLIGGKPPVVFVEETPRSQRIRGFSVFTSDEESDDGKEEVRRPDLDLLIVQPPEDCQSYMDSEIDLKSERVSGWLAFSMLPQHTYQVSVTSTMSVAESALDSFTTYRELREACLDSDFEKILLRLQTEWYYMGGSLVALSGLEGTVFSIAQSLLARRSLAVASVASGVGLCIDAWFLLRYSSASVQKFQRIATDVFGSYFFFCLSARVPALCVVISSVALLVLFIAVSWDIWPNGVLVVCFFAGVVVSLQFIAYSVHWFVRFALEMCRAIKRTVLRALATRILSADSTTPISVPIPVPVPVPHSPPSSSPDSVNQ